MRIEFLAAAALACMVCAQPVWAINKCTGPDGKTVFQDTPCAGGKGQLIEVRPASGRSPLAQPEAGQDTKQRIARTETDSKIMEAINLRQPMVGMNKAQLEQAMGAPNVVNTDNYQGRLRDQYVFERPDRTWYVYTRDGIVESFQHRPAAVATGGATICPSPAEIRDAEVSASSIRLSEAERVERIKMIAEMRRCGRR